jgi:hypothetical protein
VSASDKTQIGLSEKATDHLERLREDYAFRTEQDVYRMAIAVAIAADLPAAPEDVTRVTKYNVGGLDPAGALTNAVRYLRTDHNGRPVAYMERLAESGLMYLFDHIDDGKPLGELLGKFAPPPGVGS